MSYEYYSLLEVERTASADEIKKAYRKKAMEVHPDRHGGDKSKEAEFKKLNEAYSTLSDEQKKAHYDRFGTAEGMWGMWGGGFGGFQWGFDASDLGDIFSQFFGGGFGAWWGRKRADIGEDIEIRMSISLEDAIRGNTRKVEFKKRASCQSCNGKWGKTATCDTCRGSGKVRERMQTVFGVMEQERVCGTCSGTWEKITEKCSTCHGKKYTEESIKKDIEIPAGIEDGMSIKMRSEGHMGRDGSGDLYIAFEVPEREWWLTRESHTLHYEVKLSPAEATLGCEKIIEIPIIGKKTLSVKHGTQGMDTHKFSNEWVARLDRKWAKWDLIIHYTIDIPTRLSSDEKKLYSALLELQGGKKAEKWFFEKIFE
jgi:molecular chaperone DnaJ